MTHPVLSLKNIQKTYHQGEENLNILQDVSFKLSPGEIVALVAPSGAGKTTLLNIAGLLDRPTKGDVLINGRSTTGMSDKERTQLRAQALGFVYQFHHLQSEFSALENVMLPLLISGWKEKQAAQRAEVLLASLGLGARLSHRPHKLSGGEQQRVAIARALAPSPQVLLADEPTGNLDMDTSDVVFGEMIKLVRTSGLSALIATHNLELARRMDRTLILDHGIIS